VRHRRFHPDENVVEGDGLDPALEMEFVHWIIALLIH
jgi:hypothetical protein